MNFLKIYLFYLFIFGCVRSSLLCTGFLQLWHAGATLRCGARASHCGGFSCCGARALGLRASVVTAHGLSSCGSRTLECRLSSCGTWAELLLMWDFLDQGSNPCPLHWLADSQPLHHQGGPVNEFLKIDFVFSTGWNLGDLLMQ